MKPSTAPVERPGRLESLRVTFRELPATLRLVWGADRAGALVIGAATAALALLPAALAWVGKLIVDGVVEAAGQAGPSAVAAAGRTTADAASRVAWLVGLELLLMAAQLGLSRLSAYRRELLRASLGNVLQERILQKALELELRHFEDSETYDKMQNARREAATRPLSLAMQLVSIGQSLVTLAALSGLLWRLSPASVAVVAAASIPAFLAEAKLAGESFKLYSWRAPEGRRLNYLEWILTRDAHVKEVKLYGLGPLVLGRYRALFQKFFAEDRRLAARRLAAGVGFGLLSLLAFYGMYALMAGRAAAGAISLGDLTLYIAVFRQGQGSLQSVLASVGGMYEDALFMQNLFAYLAIPAGGERPRITPAATLPRGVALPLELDHVSFRYPGREAWALQDVSLVLPPGQTLGLVGENGAGKSTIVKLLLRLHEPTSGAIRWGGVDLRDLEPADLRSRIGAVFQDYVRYQFSAAENIGLGEPSHLEDQPRIEAAARSGGAAEVIAGLPQGYQTVLGGWFERGQDLSAGQWQKLAVARAFMREGAQLLILDEPTAAIDAEAEHELFLRFRALAAGRSALVISHRFSTVRLADQIAVLHGGRLVELGSHQALLAQGGRYAHLFGLQAKGYL